MRNCPLIGKRTEEFILCGFLRDEGDDGAQRFGSIAVLRFFEAELDEGKIAIGIGGV